MRKELIPLLIERAINRHTGRGINYGCDCEFCIAKKRVTREIGSAYHLMTHATTQPISMRPYTLDWDAVGNWIWRLRKAARRHARVELRQLKEK